MKAFSPLARLCTLYGIRCAKEVHRRLTAAGPAKHTGVLLFHLRRIAAEKGGLLLSVFFFDRSHGMQWTCGNVSISLFLPPSLPSFAHRRPNCTHAAHVRIQRFPQNAARVWRTEYDPTDRDLEDHVVDCLASDLQVFGCVWPSGGKCPLVGNVLSQEMSSGGCFCRKRLLVGKVLWWKPSSGGACPTCFPTLLYLPNCSPQKLCLVGYSSSSSSPLICTGSLLEHIKCWYPFSLPPKLHLRPLGQNWATPKGCIRSLLAQGCLGSKLSVINCGVGRFKTTS